MSAAPAFEGETTDVGEQTLVPGVAPISLRDRLAIRAAAPFEPKKPQRPPDIGLFDPRLPQSARPVRAGRADHRA